VSSVISGPSFRNCNSSRRFHDYSGRYKTQTSSTLYPAKWLQSCGIGFGIQAIFSNPFQSLDCSISSYRAVPDDAQIFELCSQGDIRGVQTLFDQWLSSPWDTNSRGLTPLFVSGLTCFPMFKLFLP
jgi:hypothetical protein